MQFDKTKNLNCVGKRCAIRRSYIILNRGHCRSNLSSKVIGPQRISHVLYCWNYVRTFWLQQNLYTSGSDDKLKTTLNYRLTGLSAAKYGMQATKHAVYSVIIYPAFCTNFCCNQDILMQFGKVKNLKCLGKRCAIRRKHIILNRSHYRSNLL